jgi:hypothetical protein
LALHPDKNELILLSHNSDILANPSYIAINLNDCRASSLSDLNLTIPMAAVNSLPDPSPRFLGVHFDPYLTFKCPVIQLYLLAF